MKKTFRNSVFLLSGKERSLENCFLCNVQAWGWRNTWTLSTEYYRSLRVATKSMEQSPSWEANRFLASPHIVWKKKKGSLPHSQEHATCPYSELDHSIPCPYPTSWTSISILYFHLSLGVPSGFFLTGLPPEPWITSALPSVCHLLHLSLPWLIAGIIFVEDYRPQSLSLCSFLLSRITCSPLGPHISICTLFLGTVSLCYYLIVRN